MDATTTASPASAPGPLAGRRAVVTGASAGIGRATAVTLAAQGAQVFALARRAGRLAVLADAHDRISPVAADVTDQASMHEAARITGPVDLVVANAGTLDAGLPGESWDRTIAVNLLGVLHTVAAYRPALEAAGDLGLADLVLVSSNAAREETPRRSAYIASKAAVSALGGTWRHDFLGTGVRVTTIEPGIVRTEILDQPAEAEDRRLMHMFAERNEALDPGDIADTIAFAVSRRPGVNVRRIVVMSPHQV